MKMTQYEGLFCLNYFHRNMTTVTRVSFGKMILILAGADRHTDIMEINF